MPNIHFHICFWVDDNVQWQPTNPPFARIIKQPLFNDKSKATAQAKLPNIMFNCCWSPLLFCVFFSKRNMRKTGKSGKPLMYFMSIFCQDTRAPMLVQGKYLEQTPMNVVATAQAQNLDHLDHNWPSKLDILFSPNQGKRHIRWFVLMYSIKWYKFPDNQMNLENPFCPENRIVL